MVSDEDKALFRKAAGAVKALKKKPVATDSKPLAPQSVKRGKPAPKPEQQLSTPVRKKEAEVYLSSYYPEDVQANTLLAFSDHKIPAKRMRELRQGRIRWESRLDLHGLKQDEAQQTLVDFIARACSMEQRCLLIIHGKGSRSGEAPVLKNLVNHWLRQLPAVLAFHSAQPKDGGAGALYVLLKRNRDAGND